MMGLHFMDEVPFRDVYIHALVRDERGAKMSKSKGNVIDPLNLIDRYGADALRFTLAAMAAQGRDIKLSVQRVEGYRNFATKIWNAARFAEMNGCVRARDYDPQAARETLNRWALGECDKAVAEVTAALESYRFNEAAGALYRFAWGLFCDWYLELAKPVLQGSDGPAKQETRATVAYVLDRICKLLHPFMPFLTEELWSARGEGSLLALAPWPARDGLADEAAEAEIGWVVDLVSEIRSARSETNVPPGAQIPLVLLAPSPEVRDRLARWRDTIRPMARLSDASAGEGAPGNSVQLIVRGETAALPLEGIVDLEAERVRLGKERQKLLAEIARIDAKLANPDFIARAPEEVVEEQRERKEDAEARLRKIEDALSRLKGTNAE
jgi:valyl-tRNA synthetase